jgi:DNA-binding response OmpR family regulator
MKMLVAEDNRASRTLMEKLLATEGHEVVTAASGKEALDLFTERQPQIVFLDWVMPGMDGIELVKRIRELEKGQRARSYVIMVTAKSGKGDMMKALEAGVDDFVTKPIDRGALISRIKVGERASRYKEADAVKVLLEEHKLLERMAKVLEAIANSLVRLQVPPRILEWCAATATVLMSETHHRKEDHYTLLFLDRAIKVHGETPKSQIFTRASLKKVEEEHHEIEALLKELKSSLTALSRGDEVDKEGLKAKILKYVALQRDHLAREEKTYFPLTCKYLEAEDEASLAERFEAIDRDVGLENLERRRQQIERAEEILHIKSG